MQVMLHNDHRLSPSRPPAALKLFVSEPDESDSLDTRSVNFDDHGVIWSGLKYAAQQFADCAGEQGLTPTTLQRPEIYTTELARTRIGAVDGALHIAFRTPTRARVLPGARNLLYFPWGFRVAPQAASDRLPLASCARAFAIYDGIVCDTEAAADTLRALRVCPVSQLRLCGPERSRTEREPWAEMPAVPVRTATRRSGPGPDVAPLGALLRPDDRPPPPVFAMHVNVRDWDPCFRSAVLGFLAFSRMAGRDARLVILADANAAWRTGQAIDALFRQLMLPEGIATDRILVVPYTGARGTRLDVGGSVDFAVSYSGAAHADIAFLDLVAGGALPIAVAGATLDDYLSPAGTIVVPSAMARYHGADLLRLFPPEVGACIAHRHIAAHPDFAAGFVTALGLTAEQRLARRAAVELRLFGETEPDLRQTLALM